MSLSLEVALSLTPQAHREEGDPPEKPVCSICQSSDVTFDASAWWDAETQRFEYDIVKGNVFCLDCAEEHSPDWVAA